MFSENYTQGKTGFGQSAEFKIASSFDEEKKAIKPHDRLVSVR
jgi:hypothetical protein